MPIVADVGQRLRRHEIVRVELALHLAEQVQRADDLSAQPHRERVHRAVPARDGFRREAGPSSERRRQVGAAHGLTGAIAVEAGALVVLYLEQLEQLHPVTRRRRDVDRARRVGEEQAGLRQLEELDGALWSAAVRKSTTSKSATSVSATSTNVRARSSSRGATAPSSLSSRKLAHHELRNPQHSGDDVGGDDVDRTPLSVGMRTEPDECIRDPDAKLLGDHPRCLVHLPPQALAVVELTRDHAQCRLGLEREQRLGDDAREHQGVDCPAGRSGILTARGRGRAHRGGWRRR